MSTRHRLIQGALVLTLAGFLSRLMGFFFRIFLSHAFGEENVGLYQLIFPVYSLCLSLSTAGIQTAISRTVARMMSLGRHSDARNVLYCGLAVTTVLSFLEVLILQQNAGDFAVRFLGDARCEELLLIISYALPCAAVHSCICGYCFGMQKTKVPALSQLIEQTVRICTVVLAFFLLQNSGHQPSIRLAAAGIAAGELSSALYCSRLLSRRKEDQPRISLSLFQNTGELLRLSVPLTANRTAVTLLQSIEAASIPACLKLFSHSASEALSIYGVLTGMALPCILFPSALTNSVGVMLMPAVAKKQAAGNPSAITALIRRTAGTCFMLGLACCLFFLLSGSFIGSAIFHSDMAGRFIITLAWICPFLYANSALMSTINGLGKTFSTFVINSSGLVIRIASVFLAIPRFGIQGYLWGLLLSQFAVTLLAILLLFRELSRGETIR